MTVEWEIQLHDGTGSYKVVSTHSSATLGEAMREIHELLPEMEPLDATAYAVIAQPHSDRPLKLARHNGRLRGWTGM